MSRDERSLEAGDQVGEGGGCSLHILGSKGFDLRVTGWVAEEGVQLFDRLQKTDQRSPNVLSRERASITFWAVSHSARAAVTVDNSPIFFAVATS